MKRVAMQNSKIDKQNSEQLDSTNIASVQDANTSTLKVVDGKKISSLHAKIKITDDMNIANVFKNIAEEKSDQIAV